VFSYHHNLTTRASSSYNLTTYPLLHINILDSAIPSTTTMSSHNQHEEEELSHPVEKQAINNHTKLKDTPARSSRSTTKTPLSSRVIHSAARSTSQAPKMLRALRSRARLLNLLHGRRAMPPRPRRSPSRPILG
jgi:hypothetical protein